MDRELFTGYHVTGRRVIPQVCGPDRGRHITMGVNAKELVIVRRDIVGRSRVLGSIKKLLLDGVVRGGRCR